MNVKAPSGSRAFERVLRAPLRLPRFPRPSSGEKNRKFFYKVLTRVSVHHTYYNASDGRCPDFTFRPTPASAALMADLGLLFRAEATGFSVLYDENRREILLRFLRRADKPFSRLSFQLISSNDSFVSFTRIPIATDPAAENFYFTNQKAHRSDDLLILNQDGFVTERELLPVVPGQVPVPIDDQPWVDEARVLDIAGEVALCVPRCVTLLAATTKNPASFTCRDKGDGRCTDRIFLNFSSLPEDKYKLLLIGADGFPIGEPWEVLYTSFYPMPLGFVDLLLTSPDGEHTDHYPVRDLLSPLAEIVPVHYTLRFERRSTLWNYYIVPPRPDRFTDLHIETEPATGFDGPNPVLLPDGRPAFHFVSQEPIPLQRQSEYRFRLKGRNLPSLHESVLVDRLPVASRQVLPQRDPLLGESSIYVYI